MPQKIPSYLNDSSHTMVFVDGENFAIQAKKIIADKPIICGNFIYEEDVYLWSDHMIFYNLLGTHPKRTYYYTVVTGDSDKVSMVFHNLRNCSITDPVVIKKPRGSQRKFVDIQLTCDVLAHVFRNNLDCVVLVAGDKDYVPLIREIKRCGKCVSVWFWGKYASDEIKSECDIFWDLEKMYFDTKPELLLALS